MPKTRMPPKRTRNRSTSSSEDQPAKPKDSDDQAQDRLEGNRSDVPLSRQEKWTCNNDPYLYLDLDEKDALKDPWKHCYDTVDKRDDEICKDLQDEIASLLVIAGLILGIITAFTLDSYKWLQEDPTQTGTELLQQVVMLLNNTTAQGTASPPAPFSPENYQIVINQLWFLSLIIALTAVVIGTLCFQWLSAYRRADAKYTSSPDALALRQVRYEGLIGWGVPYIPAFLIMAVQAAVVLFVVGLLDLLWHVNKQAAMPVLIVGGLGGLLVALLVFPVVLPTLLPFIPRRARNFPQCPFKNPWSWAIHRIFIPPALLCSYIWVFLSGLAFLCCEIPALFCLIAGHPICGGRLDFDILFDSFPWWHQSQITLLKEFKWEQYDKIWRQLWEGMTLRANRCSYYLLRGLTSVLETLGSHPTATYIVHTCLQEFKGDSMSRSELDALGGLFTAGFTVLESRLLEGLRDGQNTAQKTSDVIALRRDFLSALMLQYLVAPNLALHRNFLSLRVELYVRIRNTEASWNKNLLVYDMMGPPPRDDGKNDDLVYHQKEYAREAEDLSGALGYIGKSLTCPISTPRGASSLTSELRVQFLQCMRPLINTERFRDHDAYATVLVLTVSEAEFKTWPANEEGENSNDETAGDEKEYRDTILVEHRSLEERNNAYEPGMKGTFVDPLEVYNYVLHKLEKLYPNYKAYMATFEDFKGYYHRVTNLKAREEEKPEGDSENASKEDEQEKDEKEEGAEVRSEIKEGGGKMSGERDEGMSEMRRRPSLETGAGMV